MKKYILLAAFVAAGVISVSQTQDVMTVKMKDGTSHEFKVEDVSEVTFGSSEINPSYPVAEAIDLGLPSGTLWASWNIGATAPEEYGGYYAWGETEGKSHYDWSTYKYCNGSSSSCHHIGNDIAGTEYDVAHVKWGGSWRMPSMNQINELVNNCTWTWTTKNGVNGQLVTGPNGATIFLPAAGNRLGSNIVNEGQYGYYWSSALYSRVESDAYSLYFYSISLYWGEDYGIERCSGFSVRAVKSPVTAEAIDLGLPSGTKWASWNVGASAPEEYGGYYAWGETEEKDNYSKDTYKYLDYNNNYVYIGDDIAGTEYDVAHVKWKGEWRMPTKEQIDELIDNCSTKVSLMNDVKGMLVTGPNGNTIFLPFSGIRIDDALSQEGRWGNCWSSSLKSSSTAYILNSYYYGSMDNDPRYRDQGRSVRPVCP